MNFEVYCDESLPDLFASRHPRAQYLMIGSLWLTSDLRSEIKLKIKELRRQYSVFGEVKWTKVSWSKFDFYLSLIELFMSYGEEVRFRCISVDRNRIDDKWYYGDNELGFYKFYYQLLHHWIKDFNNYSVFCDIKTNRDPARLKVLKDCLSNANLSSEIRNVQSLPSKQVSLIQLSDLLLGAASARMNHTVQSGSAKEALLEELESRLGLAGLGPTARDFEKFNIFKIRLQGGW